MNNNLKTIKKLVNAVDFRGKSLLSINDLSNDQIYNLFELALMLEPWNRSRVNLLDDKVMSTLFFQPSTRTRMSFETAMHRLGGLVISEANPLVTSSAAKEESLGDSLKVISKYANIIVMRHFDDISAREAVKFSESPIINGGFGHWEHPTQALLDLYTIWRTYGKVEGLKVCIASPDLVEARTGHSMAYGLARLGAKVSLASLKDKCIPREVVSKIEDLGEKVDEKYDFSQKSFNEFISGMDMVYLPGCSAPKGPEADKFKKIMDDYYVSFDTLNKIKLEEGRTISVTHTLPRRAGEIDLRIDDSEHQLYFEAIAYSVSLRMALITSILYE
ncbi:MAG: hypothetical protein RBT34_08915 [Anaerolineaceae bacterium]|jgi:aspartate carbamoyltransferase catalytic subunit|nr:hypothetical protein [Anaerolineaceae bacterium]